MHRSNTGKHVLAALLFLIIIGASQFLAPTLACADAQSAIRPLEPAAQPAAQPADAGATTKPPAAKLFGQFCAKCHGADGTGNAVRKELPKIPNFTDPEWHTHRKDAQLTVSILDGKGASMPSFNGKIDQRQVRALVMHVRAFAPAAKKPRPKESKPPNAAAVPAPASVEKRLLALKQELDELREQFRQLSADPRSPSAGKRAEVKPAVGEQPAAPARTLFAQHCKRCHGADGTGSAARDRLKRIPNFTDAAWQARRSDAQLIASILAGRGGKMPPWRDKISEGQVRGLVAYIRTFPPTDGKPPPNRACSANHGSRFLRPEYACLPLIAFAVTFWHPARNRE